MKYYRMLLKKPLRDFFRMSGDVYMDGRKIKCAHVKNTQPTVVFENGFCSGVSCMKYWDEVFLSLSKEFSLFAYDRVDEVLENEVIEESVKHLDEILGLLRRLLKEKGLKAPYILVGHSLGGLYMQYYANKYPDEVAGIVLVDATYPQSHSDESLIYKNIAQIGKTVLEMVLPVQKPMVIFSATQDALKNEKCAKANMVEQSIEDQKKYAIRYPKAKQIWVDSGHLIQYEKPEVIVDAIRALAVQS